MYSEPFALTKRNRVPGCARESFTTVPLIFVPREAIRSGRKSAGIGRTGNDVFGFTLSLPYGPGMVRFSAGAGAFNGGAGELGGTVCSLTTGGLRPIGGAATTGTDAEQVPQLGVIVTGS